MHPPFAHPHLLFYSACTMYKNPRTQPNANAPTQDPRLAFTDLRTPSTKPFDRLRIPAPPNHLSFLPMRKNKKEQNRKTKKKGWKTKYLTQESKKAPRATRPHLTATPFQPAPSPRARGRSATLPNAVTHSPRIQEKNENKAQAIQQHLNTSPPPIFAPSPPPSATPSPSSSSAAPAASPPPSSDPEVPAASAAAAAAA
ncbi:hypothetical protein BDY21DRAFT_344912, partial [Lineolata rhizophorae]